MLSIFKIEAYAHVSNWTRAQRIANNNLNAAGGGARRGFGNARTQEGRAAMNTVVNARNAGQRITRGMLNALQNTAPGAVR